MAEQDASNSYLVVSTAPNLAAADMIVSYLQSHGVEARVKDALSSGVASLSALPDGFRVEVQAHQRDVASKLLEERPSHKEGGKDE